MSFHIKYSLEIMKKLSSQSGTSDILPRIAAPHYLTDRGICYQMDWQDALTSNEFSSMKGKASLILTSPPFPLNRKKKYGNLNGDDYLDWMAKCAEILSDFVASNGSIVIEMGNAWNKGSPTMSLLPIQALMKFKEAGHFHLCQEFICYNPARLPSPVAWVNVERIRVKDSYTRIWWLSKNEKPKADNKKVLTPYSVRMKNLLEKKTYNSGHRPSGHTIGGQSFLKDNGLVAKSNPTHCQR